MERTIVTGALPYANGELHLGHIKSTYVPADIYTRFLKFIGLPAIYLCANDEHGTPILFKSEEQKIKPEEYIQTWRKRNIEDLKFLKIKFDEFYATHNERHIKITQDFYNKLKENGYIYKGKVKQHWCEKENKVLPDRYVIGTCPFCKADGQYGDQCEVCGKVIPSGELINPRCKTCGSKAIIREGTHTFFKLSSFTPQLKKFLEVVKAPQDIKNFVGGWLKESIRDWDIERDIPWGIPIPDSKGVFYVWFDAPIAYVSTLDKWAEEKGEDKKEWWDKVVHFIGKDIAYHHFLFWPAILSGAGWKLPTRIPVRGYLTLEGKKFSKSRKWYISIKQWKDASFDPEYLRFFMAFTTPEGMKDSDFSAREFQKVVNEELVNNFGNLLQRVLKFSEMKKLKIEDVKVNELFFDVQKGLKEYEKLMKDTKFSKALKIVTKLTHNLNTYFQEQAPWKNEDCISEVMRTVASSLVLINKMLYPILPQKTKLVAKLLNVELSWKNNDVLKPGHVFKRAKILFPKFDDEQTKKLRRLYEKA